MTVYRNAEIRQAGNIIRVNVEVDACVPITGPSSAQVQWSGVLRPPNNTGLALGEIYLLVLPGFKPGKIEVTSEGNPVDGTVTFVGVGELPKPESKHAESKK